MTKTIKRKQGKAIPNPEMETGVPYQDPVHVREWAASSAAGMNSSLDFGTSSYPQAVMTMDPNFPLAMDTAVPQPDFTSNQMQATMLAQSLGFDSCASLGPSYDVSAPMTGAPYSGTELSFVQNDWNFDGCMSLPIDNGAYPSPLMETFPLIDSAGPHPMCNQTSSQGFPDYSEEWTSRRSSPGTNGVPMTRIGSGSQSMNFTSSDFGSSTGSMASHLISPLSMAPTDDSSWPVCDVTGYGLNGPFPQSGVPDGFQLPPTGCSMDQRCAFITTYAICDCFLIHKTVP